MPGARRCTRTVRRRSSGRRAVRCEAAAGPASIAERMSSAANGEAEVVVQSHGHENEVGLLGDDERWQIDVWPAVVDETQTVDARIELTPPAIDADDARPAQRGIGRARAERVGVTVERRQGRVGASRPAQRRALGRAATHAASRGNVAASATTGDAASSLHTSLFDPERSGDCYDRRTDSRRQRRDAVGDEAERQGSRADPEQDELPAGRSLDRARAPRGRTLPA